MELDTEFMAEALPAIIKAVPLTLFLAALSLALALVPAFLMALARIKGRGFADKAVTAYVSIIRGTPLILQILLLYSLLPSFLNMIVKASGSGFNVFEGINPFWYAVVVFTLHTIALLSEVFRSAILSVPVGQMEAGLTIGVSRFQVYKEVVIPQALVSAIPNLCNISVNLIKGTSLAFFMGVKDIMAEAKIEAAFGYNYIEAYLEVFIFYIIICTIVQVVYKLTERAVGSYRVGQEA